MTAIPAEIRAEIEKLERKHGDNPDGRYFVPLASAYRRSGSVDEAISVLRKGIGRHPDYLSARIVLGHCYADRGDADAARAEFEHVLSSDPHNLVALRSLGELAAASGNNDEARSRYEQLLTVDPMNEEARAGLQMLSLGTGLPGFVPPADPATPDGAPGGADVIASFPRASAPAHGDAGATDVPAGVAPPASASRAEAEAPRPEGGEGDGYDGEEIVVTETIAELYTRQGFFARAAHVYRELLRRQGEDPRLRERLDRVERLARGEEVVTTADAAPAEAGAAPETPSVSDPDAGAVGAAGDAPGTGNDPFAESFAAGFPRVEADEVEIVAASGVTIGTAGIEADETGDEPAPADTGAVGGPDAPTGAPEPDLAAAAPAGGIGDYLLGVLDWNPPAADPPPPEAPIEAIAETFPANGEADSEVAADGSPASPAAQDEDDLFPWEMPEPAGSAPAQSQPKPATPSVTASPFAFDDNARTKTATSPAHDGVARVPPVSSGPVSSGPASPTPSPGTPDIDDDDDDDIESFQAWLRSLKR